MCGRFSLITPPEEIASYFNAQVAFDLEPRYNIAPGQPILAIRLSEQQHREAAMLHWGLIPHWAEDASIGYKMINARAETVAEKPSFRDAYRKRHCLIPVSGFYEWKGNGRQKLPYYFYRQDEEPFALAGLWEQWHNAQNNQVIESCTIITNSANSLVAPVHHRMPVVIEQPEIDQWLDTAHNSADLLLSRDWSGFEAMAVSTYVNRAENEGPECLQPI